ncbi:MAG: hypothetical protein M1385_00105 [Candidatus Marsarchaeota archaeon]|nr:hypothetical protein [Candidatus Marsarchaeota archaeon]
MENAIKAFRSKENSTDVNANDKIYENSNLPDIFALAEYNLKLYEIIDITSYIYIVFDSPYFLTVARDNRYREVKPVLDKAQNNEKVFFCTKRCPFTHKLSPSEAVQKILGLKGYFKKFTPETRKEYFSLISNVTEDKF